MSSCRRSYRLVVSAFDFASLACIAGLFGQCRATSPYVAGLLRIGHDACQLVLVRRDRKSGEMARTKFSAILGAPL